MSMERISELADRSTVTSQTKVQREKRMKKQRTEHLRKEMWDKIKKCNTCVIRIPEGEEREQKRYLK